MKKNILITVLCVFAVVCLVCLCCEPTDITTPFEWLCWEIAWLGALLLDIKALDHLDPDFSK